MEWRTKSWTIANGRLDGKVRVLMGHRAEYALRRSRREFSEVGNISY